MNSEIPADLRPHLRRSVRSIIAAPGNAGETLCHIAMGQKHSWSWPEYRALLTSLSRCADKLETWLQVNL